MQLFLMGIGAIVVIVGSLIATALLYSVLWRVFRIVNHPELTSPVVLALVSLPLTGEVPRNELTDMFLTFAVVAALPVWFGGLFWRRERAGRSNPVGGRGEPAEPTTERSDRPRADRMYPAITACICENRAPSRNEVHIVAQRLWREGLAQHFQAQAGPASFRARRALLRATGAAQGGGRNASGSRLGLG